MTFRGFFQLDGQEIANSNRVIAHVGRETPTSDLGQFVRNSRILIEDPPGSGLYLPTLPPAGPDTYQPGGLVEDPPGSGLFMDPNEGPGGCELQPAPGLPGFFTIPASSKILADGYSIPNGARRIEEGLYAFDGRCWEELPQCGHCNIEVNVDDGWDGLREFLQDARYRPFLAPWYSTRVPESAEFSGVWVMSVKGLDSQPITRGITELAGDGAAAGRARTPSRKVEFEALLLGCTDAGLTYGLEWLNCQLRRAEDSSGSRLRYFAANPTGSLVDPSDLLREAHGTVLTQEAQVVPGASSATTWRVTWQMQVTAPHIYYPTIRMPVEWNEVAVESMNWVHAVDCKLPESCDKMPVLFSATCTPEIVEVVSTPPPVCGGCLPVCTLARHVWRAPTRDFPLRCRSTAVSMTITNTGQGPLTIQTYWRVCGTDVRCEDDQFPIQINGLPAAASVTIDSVTGEVTAEFDGRQHTTQNIVSTPHGAPWDQIVVDRATCWEFVVLAPLDADFEVSAAFADRVA